MSYYYRLLGVVEHSGTMRGVHYVAYVRVDKNRGNTVDNGESKWFYAGDADVREVLTEVLRYMREVLVERGEFDGFEIVQYLTEEMVYN